MGGSQSLPTLLGGNFNALGLGNSITAEQITKGLNLEEYNAIVTGGSSGMGAEMARVLAKRGAQVTIAARREDVLQDVKASILSETPMARVDVLPLDLSKLSSVREFAVKYKQNKRPLNILINNGGIFCKEFTTSDEGIERMWATHVVGHYALTMLLMDNLKKTAADSGIEGRVMFTGSEGHRVTYPGGIDFDTLTSPSRYTAYQSYGMSKVGEILLARMIGPQLQKEGANVMVNSGHPGSVKTPLGQNFFNKGVTEIGYQVSKPFIKTPQEGAMNLIYVATNPKIKGVTGKYFSDRTEIKPSESASSDELGEKVVKYCEDFMTAKIGR